MEDYEEATAIRRSVRLVFDAGGPDFSVLNYMVYAVLVALVVYLIGSIFS